MKIGCLIYAVGDRYEKLAQCALRSFTEFHPDIEMNLITRKTISEYDVSKNFDDIYYSHHGIFRYAIALEIMKKNNYDKIIVLGADTITCARLEEFINENDIDILATSDANYQVPFPYRSNKGEPYDMIYTPFTVELRSQTVSDWLPSTALEYADQKSITFYNSSVIKTDKLLKADHLKFPGYVPGRMINEHINSDVTCFNGRIGLERVIRESLDYSELTFHCWRNIFASSRAMEGFATTSDEMTNLTNLVKRCPSFVSRRLKDETPRETDERLKDFQKRWGDAELMRPTGPAKLEVVGEDGLPGYPLDFFGEQGGLNIINIVSKIPDAERSWIVDTENAAAYSKQNMIISDVKIKVIDGVTSNYFYNIGSRIGETMARLNSFFRVERENLKKRKVFTESQLETIINLQKEYFINTKRFSVKDGRLYSTDGKQIKVWHYCIGPVTDEKAEEVYNSYIFCGFNKETKEFFKQHCGCGSFFEKQFII